jgi:hypothetical protein
MAKMPEHLQFLAKYKKRARYSYVYTEQQPSFGMLQAEPPPIWAAYLNVDASPEQKEEGPWEMIGRWHQTGVSHMHPQGWLVIQWQWVYSSRPS